MNNIYKIFFVFALWIGMNNHILAQEGHKNPKAILGIRGGITFAPANWEGTDIKVFPTVGLAASFRIAKLPLYIETGAYYTDRFLYGWDNHSILLPALMSYHFSLKKEWTIQPFMGPFLTYGFDASEVDFGCRMGVGFNRNHFYINCGYDISGNYGVDEDALFVGVGYNF